MMMRVRWRHLLAMGIAAAVLVLAACGASSAASGSTVVKTKSVSLNGTSTTVLADTSGRTLYYFMPDTATSVACTDSCTSLWPPLLLASGDPASSDSLSGTLSVMQGANGRQVTYNGHPLYTYSKDSGSGDALGEGILGKWFVATGDIPALSGSGAQPSPTSGGYNY
jgi:predicted lipoprotein with Yx(FWY)xxD motif